MDNDIKVTYSVIAVLIVLMGGLAYFLQDTIDLPQVKVGTVSTSTETVKKNTAQAPVKIITNATSTMSTTTSPVPEKVTKAVITTNKGIIEVTFSTSTPVTVANFAKLSSEGFYNGTRFHRVIRDFMIQGGDPLSKDITKKAAWGTGGPGYSFEDETSPSDVFSQGVLAMANSGPNTNGSQFFIVTSIAGTPWLAGKHTVFGHVTRGLDIALLINDMQTDGADRPLQDVVVEKIEVK
ncbi:MAG: peptidylprolyl isomerase [Candidatus Paceibacterota bacterium]